MIKAGIPPKNSKIIKKWLRYYIDFCFKYDHDSKHPESLPLFINKLRQKNQTRQKQKQAYDSILIYYAMYDIHPDWSKGQTISRETEKQALVVDEQVVSYSLNDTALNLEWDSVYQQLSDEIKVRHYSPKTFKAYSKWVTEFQGFVKNKPPGQLSADDVKLFLTYLAVERHCSASAQNQAFNGLLFFSGIS